MRRFLVTVLIFILILSGVTVSVNALYVRRDHSDKYGTDKFLSMPETIAVCNFGSSHGLNGFNYSDLEQQGISCFNFAMTSQFISYDLRLLEQYGDRLAEGAIVLIPVSYFSLFGLPETEYEEFEGKNRRYYRVLDPARIKSYEPMMDLYVNHFPSLVAASNLVPVLLGKSTPADTRWAICTEPSKAAVSAEAAAQRHIVENKYDGEGHRIINEEEVGALISMIEYCKELHTQPVPLTTPYLREYSDAVRDRDEDFFTDFMEIMNRVREETDCRYLDYSGDERFAGEYELFTDADHLNREGARIFTDLLMKEISGQEANITPEAGSGR